MDAVKIFTKKLSFTFIGIVLFSFCYTGINAQNTEEEKRKSVYVELLGSGVFGSVNYDFRLSQRQDGLGMRVGAGMIPDVLIVPIELNGLIGQKKVAFEYGAGISHGIFLKPKAGDETFSTGIDGYGFIVYAKGGIRVHPKNNGIVFNFNWMPMMNAEEIRWIWFGIGIGYSWR